MHPAATVESVFILRGEGLSQAAIAHELGISVSTIRHWLTVGIDPLLRRRGDSELCPALCRRRDDLSVPHYAYLLGQYLGDGWIDLNGRRGVFKLGIACAAEYPDIVAECEDAVRAVLPENRSGRVHRQGVVFLQSYSKHWPCLFPQCGPGPKHARPIVLEDWQRQIALVDQPQMFLRGLIHSDGWRGLNTVVSPAGTRYEYVRYQFSNRSIDIQRLFAAACEAIGVECRQMNRHNVSVNRRESVEALDPFIGPKS